jgi:ABC-type Fe3+/spermidine/putrescine transport system ATPase subunit
MRDEVRRVTRELGISALFVTHNQDEGLSIADSVAIINAGCIVQQDSPEKIFREPADRYVAGFIGTANVFPVLIERSEGGILTLTGRLPARLCTNDQAGFSAGDSAYIMIRPHNLYFCRGDERNAIPVRIEARRFLGDRYEYTCSSNGSDLNVLDDERIESGRDVFVRFDPMDGYLLAGE